MARGTVLVTGATGRIGPTVLDHLGEHGYRTVGVSRSGPAGDAPVDRSIRADCTDAGDVYGALAAVEPDAIVHLGTLSDPRNDPGHVVFDSQVRSTYVVCEAAAAVGVDRVVAASSLAALGTSFQPEPVRVDALPVDESHRLTAHDPYGLGKRAAEVAADGVASRPDGPDVVSLRFPTLFDDDRLATVLRGTDRSLDGLRAAGVYATARDTLFAWLHVDDAAAAVRRAIAADVSGHEPLWLSAPDTTVDVPSATLAAETYPDAEVREPLDGYEPLLDDSRARRVLDWSPSIARQEVD
jgi:nucleoside-diphosphate-sugar epimerase